ncbi:MAG: DUF1440 domain-containing protein [Candidatus Acidiferrales bacterium]
MWHERNVGKGMIAGLVGGLIGTIVMTEFQSGWNKASSALKNGSNNTRKDGSQHQGEQEKEDATMKAAGKIAELGGHHLSHEQKKKLGPVVHYSFGTLQGAAYGAVTEMAGESKGLLSGLIFGAALYLVADELAVPALGLSGKPNEYPLSSHFYGLASHIVYGLSAEMARRVLRAVMD